MQLTIDNPITEFDVGHFDFFSFIDGRRTGSATEYKVSGGIFGSWDATGHDLRYDDQGFPISGSFTNMTWNEKDVHQVITFEGANVAAERIASVARSATLSDDLQLMHKLLDGNDTITSGRETVTLYGYSGDDVITGSGKLYGGPGNDTITGTGENHLDGGAGHDTFIFARHSENFIDDFKAGGKNHDVIELSDDKDIPDFDHLKEHMKQVGDNIEIFSKANNIHLLNVSIQDLHAHDFIFT